MDAHNKSQRYTGSNDARADAHRELLCAPKAIASRAVSALLFLKPPLGNKRAATSAAGRLAAVVVVLSLLAGCAHYQAQPLSVQSTYRQLQARSLDDPGLRAFLEQHLSRRLAPWPPGSWDLELLTGAAFYYQPGLTLARKQWETAQAAEITAGARPNPTVSVTPGYSFNPASGVSPWFPSGTLDWPVETAGKRGYRIARAQQLAEAARWNITTTAWQLRGRLRAALVNLVAAERRQTLFQEQREVQAEIVHLLEQRFQAGAVASTDVTVQRVALARLDAALADARQQAAEARPLLAVELGLPAQALHGVPFAWPALALPDITPGPALEKLRENALQNHSEIRALLAEYEAAQSALQLEIARQYPDVHLGTGYQWDQGEHKWSLGLSMDLPILNRNEGPIAEATAKRSEIAARFVERQAKILSEIDRAAAGWNVMTAQLDQMRQARDAVQHQLEAARARFKAGGADRLEVENADLETRVSALALLEVEFKAQQLAGRLEEALHQPLGPMPRFNPLEENSQVTPPTATEEEKSQP